jgi:hypothetical protein
MSLVGAALLLPCQSLAGKSALTISLSRHR